MHAETARKSGVVSAKADAAKDSAKGSDAKAAKKPVNFSSAWPEARRLMWLHRGRLAVGFVLMLIGRGAGLVLPATSKSFIDDVVGNPPYHLLPLLLTPGAFPTRLHAPLPF